MMLKKLLLGVAPLWACVGAMPAQAAPVVKSYTVSGSVAKTCFAGTVPSMAPTGSVVSASPTSITMATQSWTWNVKCSNRFRITVTASSLKNNTAGTGKVSNYANYTTTLSGWLAASTSVATTDTKNGSNRTASVSQDSLGLVSTTVTISASNATRPTDADSFVVGTYTGAIAIALTPL